MGEAPDVGQADVEACGEEEEEEEQLLCTHWPYSTPLRNRFGAVLGRFCRLRGEMPISQNWLKGQNMAAMLYDVVLDDVISYCII